LGQHRFITFHIKLLVDAVIQASTSAAATEAPAAPCKCKLTEEDIEIDAEGGVRRRMERMSINVKKEPMGLKK
jgi:hypothetical protein